MTRPITRQLLTSKAGEYRGDARSQLHQDAFVLEVLDNRKYGYFVDVGAADGFTLSNTHLLEKRFGWSGILAEPAKGWHHRLYNRTSRICTQAVWRESGIILPFMEPSDAFLSSLSCRAVGDGFEQTRFAPTTATYDVTTISLLDLLDSMEAPTTIDYLSLDTEGSEFDILVPFDFSEYRFLVITCEHNHNHNRRQKTFNVLTCHGYRRVCEDLSAFEDWYVHESVGW